MLRHGLQQHGAKSDICVDQAFDIAGKMTILKSRGEVNDDIRNALDDGALVTIFPEGTSSDGRAVLPFRSPLLEPATRLDQPLTVARLQYTLADGSPDEEVAYWGDATFFPHLLNLLSRDRVQSTVRFGIVTEPVPDRKALALQLHSAVSALK